MLIEAKIILPVMDELTGALFPLSYSTGLQHELVETFGGFTTTAGHGGWKNGKGHHVLEPVAVYTVAIGVDTGDKVKIKRLALKYGEIFRQEAVYVSFADTGPEILTVENGIRKEQ